jgi:uncharacterized protein (TIGR02466 family)
MSKFKNNLIDTNIFPSFIVSTDLRSLVSNDDINSEFSDIRNSDGGISITNVGGWHSQVYNKTTQFSDYTHLNKLYTLAIEFIDEFLETNNTELYVNRASSWLLENESDSYNTMHNHGKTDLIAVYYVSAPKNCNGITLLRTDAFTHTALCESNKSNEFSISYTPEINIGRLYVMSGHLYHHVKPFDSSGLRRSVVFNINCEKIFYRQSG